MMAQKCLTIFTTTAMLLLVGCNNQAAEKQSLSKDEVKITYQANTTESGDCNPVYQAHTKKDADGLPANKIYIMRGETEYFYLNKYKMGEIPFQLKMFREINGMPSEGLSCKELFIKITLEKCQYEYPIETTTCPKVVIEGEEAFGGIEILDIP